MRLVLIGLLLVLAIVIIVSGIKSKKGVAWFLVVLCVIPAAAMGYFEYKWVEAQEKISATVAELTNIKSANFECERATVSFFDAFLSEKTTSNTGLTAGLKSATCGDLLSWYNLENKNVTPTSEQIVGIHVLAMEVVRISGYGTTPEQTECLAIRETPRVAEALGASPDMAQYISLYYQQHILPNQKSTEKFRC